MSTISDLIAELQQIRAEHGNLEVVDASDEQISPEVVDGVLVLCDRA